MRRTKLTLLCDGCLADIEAEPMHIEAKLEYKGVAGGPFFLEFHDADCLARWYEQHDRMTLPAELEE